ncbi:MAG: dihydrolipoamide acetyltransferase family protein [Gemmatimonadales bacterium]
MATKVVMEALSPTMEEGRLVEWKKRDGDTVAVGDVLAEVETDKAVMELVARATGVLIKRIAAEGATVPVAATVAWIGAVGEAVPGTEAAPAATAALAGVAPSPSVPPPSPAPAAIPAATPSASSTAHSGVVAAPGTRVRASPLARRMAADKGVDLGGVAGTGPEGRIIQRDVEQMSTAPSPGGAAVVAGAVYADVTLTPMRKTIARRLAQSLGPIPTYYLTAEADMERAHDARDALLAQGDAGRFSFNDLIIRTVASALRQHPWVNAWWMDDKVRQWHEVHVGVAVAVEEGLITPVIRHADQKSLRQIAAEVRELAGRAREKKLKPEEYTGATFSISNLGMFGIDEFTAVINPPEAAILAIGRIEPRPVVVAGQIVVRRRMRITMSCDHRVIDGATGAAFLKTLVAMLENPLALVW